MAVESVVKTRPNADLIAEVAKLWIKPDDLVLDATYGRGAWWKMFRPSHLITNDLDTASPSVFHYDFLDLPARWQEHFDVVAFDPPYIAQAGHQTSTVQEMLCRYGLMSVPNTPQKLREFIGKGIVNVSDVVAPSGRLLVKCMDYISRGQYQSGLTSAIDYAARARLRLVDLFVHHSGSGPQPKVNRDGTPRRQLHSRRVHSYLVVFQKGR